jgi:quinol-cytochrome oxidoreductase complex cytochrome b subunit
MLPTSLDDFVVWPWMRRLLWATDVVNAVVLARLIFLQGHWIAAGLPAIVVVGLRVFLHHQHQRNKRRIEASHETPSGPHQDGSNRPLN